MKDYKIINKCLLCGKDTKIVFSLGETALANEFVDDHTIIQDIFPLNLIQCTSCNHVQIDCIVDQDRLYRNYSYVSGTSQINIKHFKEYAESVIIKCFGFDALINGELNKDTVIIDIGSNDGTFLENFIKYGFYTIGIEPALNLKQEAELKGINVIPEFFNKENASIIKSKLLDKKIKLITCNNMFAHNENLDTIVDGVLDLLDDNGIFVFENSYLLDMCDKTLIDLIYHEHMHHHHLGPLKLFFEKHGMKIFNVERIPNHGGSIRVYVCKDNLANSFRHIYGSVTNLLKEEENINEKLSNFGKNALILKQKLTNRLNDLKSQGSEIFIYGFAAKSTTLLYYLNIDKNMIAYGIDDAELKQNKFSPGKHIVIFCDGAAFPLTGTILITAWNFADSIIANHKDFKGLWIVPLPEYREIQK